MDARLQRNVRGYLHVCQCEKAQNLQQPRDVPTAVNALLDATRKLEEALQRWCTLQGTEVEVSDIYVTVGNEFHAMVASFAYYKIDMRYVYIPTLPACSTLTRNFQSSDVRGFPEELRAILEECLSEDPTPDNVNYLMPQVRSIIAKLLVGLRNKQSPYWQAVRSTRRQ
jgi:hypothetical protein